MAKFEQKDMTGTLFVNDRKKNNTSPDRTGSAVIDGVEYWVSGWIKDGQRGKFLSLAFNRKEERTQEEPPPRRAPPRTHPNDRITTGRTAMPRDLDDDGEIIPF